MRVGKGPKRMDLLMNVGIAKYAGFRWKRPSPVTPFAVLSAFPAAILDLYLFTQNFGILHSGESLNSNNFAKTDDANTKKVDF